MVAGIATIILTPAPETFPAWTPRDIVGRTGGKSEKDTHPPLVQNGIPAKTPRKTKRTLRAEATTIRAGRANDRGKEVILDQLIMQILIL